MEVLKQIMEEKIVAIIRGLELEQTVRTAGALKEGGIRLSEIPFDQTKSLDYTTDKIRAVVERYGPEGVRVGAGTVLNVEQVRAAFERAGVELTYNHLNVHIIPPNPPSSKGESD